MENNLEIRYAERKDVSLIMEFIKGLAEYEKMLDEVVADEAELEEWIFDKKKAEVIFACTDGREVGFALFFHNFSTFLGRAGIYLEDLYIIPEYRGKGYGRRMLQKLAEIAVERKCGRLEWWCLDWNKSSIAFYLSLGAEQMSDWTTYRIAGDTLKELAGVCGSRSVRKRGNLYSSAGKEKLRPVMRRSFLVCLRLLSATCRILCCRSFRKKIFSASESSLRE